MRVFPPRCLVLFCCIAALCIPAAAGTRLRTTPIPNAPPSFTASASPNPLTLSFIGDQKQVTVTTTIDPGFADSQIQYSFSGFPAFITNDGPQTTTISGNWGPVVFTFTLGTGAVPGTYNGTLTGQSNGPASGPKTFPFTVIVPQPDFTASFSNPSVQVCNGGSSVDDTIQIAPVGNYSGTVQISFGQIPAGITINPVTPNPVTLPPSRVVAFTVSANGATPGSHIVIANLKDTAQNINKNIQLIVNVVDPNFTQGVTPSSLTIAAGGGAQNISPTVTPNTCFNGNVTVAASGQPAGMTITPPQTVISGPSYNPGSMAVQASASVPAGTYPITLTYTSGNIVKTLTIPVTVNAAPDLVLNVNPSAQTVPAGGSATVTVTVTPVNNFSGTVTVTSPAASDVTFTPATFDIAPGGSQTVTLNVSPSAVGGTRSLIFTGTSPAVSGTRSAPFTLTITDFALAATPQLLTLAAGSSGIVNVSAVSSGFNGPITVTSPTVPGLTITPQTFTVTPGGPAQAVTIAVGAVNPQGITLTFSGTPAGGGATHTATVMLLITAPPDFRITVTPDSLAIADGGSATVSVGVTALNGFNGPVTITAPQIPGVTFTPSTFIVAPGATQTVTVAVAPGIAGTAHIGTFIGTAPGVEGPRTATLTLSITQRPDFTLTATPPSLAIRVGEEAVVTITATSVNGFQGPITVTAPVMPNLTFTPSTFTLLPGASQQVRLRGLQPAQPRLVIWTGTANGITHEASALVTVRPQRPILTATAPSAVAAGASAAIIRVSGDFLAPGAQFQAGDLTIDHVTILTPQLADIAVTVPRGARPGPRDVNVTNPDGGTSINPVVIFVYPASSIAAPLDVTAAAIVFPARGTMIAPKEALFPRGLLATTGTGTIAGTWQFDGVPFDRFLVNAAGGMPVEVRTNMPLPVSFTGTHTLAMVIESPRRIVSPSIEVIDAIDRVSRLTLLAPRDGAVIDAKKQLFRWSLVPNCTGFDVEVARDGASTLPDALTPMATFRVNDAEWHPTKAELASIGPGIHRWRVRPRCAGDTELEASEWQRFAILPEHVDITLLPVSGRTVRWTSGVTCLLYRVEFLSPDGKTIFAALTSATEYTAPNTLPAGTTVRVQAIAPSGAILGTSSSVPMVWLRRSHIELAQQVTVIEFGPVEPADGATVQNPQPRITAEWKGAVKADQVILLVDNTDITAVATVTPVSIAYDSLIALAPGPHSAALSVAGNINRWTFNVAMPEGAAAEAAAPAATPRGDWVIAPVGTITLVRGATNEAHTQLSALTDLNLQSTSITNKPTGDLALKHDFDQDKTTQESRNWLTDVNAHQATTSEALRFGFAGPDFFDQAQLLTAGLPRGGVQAKVVIPGGTASYYQTFTSRPAGVITGLFGPEQKVKAAAFQVPFNARWDFRVIAMRTEDGAGFNSAGGEGSAFGIFARFNIGSTVSAIFEGARGDFKPNAGSFEEKQQGNAYRLGLTGARGTLTYAFNLRRTESQFINPANRGFTSGGVPDRTGADLTIGKYFGTSSITVQLRHLQDGTTSGLFVPRTRETGALASFMKMIGQHVSLALSGNVTQDKGDEKPEIFLPKSDRSQSGGTATLSEFFGRFNFSETLSRQLLRDHVFDLNDQTITSGTLTGGGFLNQYFNLAAVLSGTRSAGSVIIGTTNQYLALLQPTLAIPKFYISFQPRASYSTSKNDLYESKTTTEQYQGLVTFAPQWAGSIVALQLSADWTKNDYAGQPVQSKFVHRYVGTINFHWRAGVGPAYTNYVPFTAPGAVATTANPAAATPGAPALPPH